MPTTVPLTEKLLINAGGWPAMKAARDIVKAGRVTEARYEPPLLSGFVREGIKNFRSGLRIKSAADVENVCTCWESRSSGKICGHSVAVGLAILRPVPAILSAPAKIEEPPQGPEFVVIGSEGAKPVKLHLILPPNFMAAWAKGQVMLVVEAEAGANRTLLSALPKHATFACDESDLALIEGLRALPAIFASGMASSSRDSFLRLLPSLQNHPRLTFGKGTHATVSSAAVRPQLEVEQRANGGITVRAKPIPNTMLLWNATEAWLLRDREFVRCGEALPAGAAHLLGSPLQLEGERALQFLAFDLPRLRDAFDIEADEGVRLPQVIPATPAFGLRLAGTLNSVTAELLCTYGNRPAFKAATNEEDEFVFRDPENVDRILLRNIPAERAAVARLERVGFARTDAAGFVLHGQPEIVRFFASDYPKFQRDWNVTLTAQVEKWTSEIERVTPRLEIVGSGVDWFEVRYSLVTPGGQEFSNSEIQQLLRSGRNQTRLKNGRLAAIDTAGLEDFEQVIRDCDPAQTQPGLYRINRAHAPYVQETARELGSTIADRREALKKFITSADTPVDDAKERLGSLAKILREYQVAGFEWLMRLAANNLGGILADEMGLGKTVQTLAFLRAQKKSVRPDSVEPPKPALIVCPTSLVTNWQSEAQKFTPELKTLVLEGPNRSALFKSIDNADVVITSYALLRRDIDDLRTFQFSTAVLDEAQHIKNPETQNAQSAFALRAKHRFVLTGTPMENSVRDLWSIMNFSLPGYLGPHKDFRERYELPLARGGAPDVQRRLSRRLQPFLLRRRKRDVAKDLPEKIEQVVPCDLASSQRSVYDALLREIQSGLGSSGAKTNAGAQRMKMLTGLLRLRQVCCDLRLVGLEKEDPSAKLELLDELLGEAIDGDHRVLVFSQFVSMLHLVRDRLEERKLTYCYLDGSTKQRQEEVNRFQSDDTIPVFLISLKAGGVGLNLSAADTVIHFDPWWNPAVEAQATDRAHRIGQTRVVTAYKLITRDTVEEKILKLQDKKRAAIDAALDSEEPLMTGLTTEELEELLT
jgi:superfamily II DNA or RNA helicase